ncbi:MAG: ribosome silencing factor [Gammaproteobacteria bacterium]|nr:ribosome silencing factor [Gammaproteobacteria bacterium]
MPNTTGKKGKDEDLVRLIVDTLEDMKAERIVSLDVRHLTSITDVMVVASGRSDRHVRAIADALLERCGEKGFKPLGVEGQEAGEWVLVDLADAIVHIMVPRVREFYNIENLWDLSARERMAES